MFSDGSCMGIKMIKTLFVDWYNVVLFYVLFNDIFFTYIESSLLSKWKIYVFKLFKYGALFCYVEHFVYEHFYIIKQCIQNKFKV